MIRISKEDLDSNPATYGICTSDAIYVDGKLICSKTNTSSGVDYYIMIFLLCSCAAVVLVACTILLILKDKSKYKKIFDNVIQNPIKKLFHINIGSDNYRNNNENINNNNNTNNNNSFLSYNRIPTYTYNPCPIQDFGYYDLSGNLIPLMVPDLTYQQDNNTTKPPDYSQTIELNSLNSPRSGE